MTTKEPIPNALLMYRKKAGLRHLDVARALGLASTDRICHWEKGRTLPNLKNLFKLSALYRVNPHQLYDQLQLRLIAEILHPGRSQVHAAQVEASLPVSGTDEYPGG